MKGEERYLLNLLEGTKTRFVIPVYQRNYDWKLEQCKQLFDDLEELVHEGGESHFFGSIVSKADGDIRVIIDGQQRITTSYLLLLALVRQLRDGGITSSDENLADMVNEEYLIDKWHKSEKKLKLKLIKDDQAAFEAIYTGDPDKFVQDSNVTQNYLFFCNRIKASQLDADQLKGAIEKLMIIDIKLDKEDDAQRIFESLNSTGLDLSEGDKIRNFILMGLDPVTQEICYEKYWNGIEKNTGYEVSSFARDWLAAIRRKTPAIKKVYTTFKDYVKSQGFDTVELLAELLKYSDHYRVITKASSGNHKIDAVLRRLNLFDASVMHPFSLNLFECRREGKVSNNEVVEALLAVESYLFRRWVCKVPTNALNKVFETLNGEVMRGVSEGGSYPEVLKKVLLSKEGSGRFPDDKEFMAAYTERDFYRIGGYRYYLYDRLENGDSLEYVNVVENLRDEVFSVEHIMPQTLSSSWLADLGEDHDAIHERWLNSMANLTLTAYNSKYSNRRFVEKRDMDDGFKDSGFRINKYVSLQDEWGEAQLEERDKLMREKFLSLWPMISSDFEWSNDVYDEHALDDDFDFSGRKIAAYSFMGSRFTTKSWVEMICGVLSMLYEIDPVVFHKFVPEGSDFPGRYFSWKSDGHPFKVGEGIYFNAGSSTSTKIESLKIIFDAAGLEGSDLSFELYKVKAEPDEDLSSFPKTDDVFVGGKIEF